MWKQALYQIGNNGDDPAAVKALGTVAGAEYDPELQETAVYALGNTGSDAAVPILAGVAKKGGSKRVRSAAVNALGQLGTDKARAALLEILEMKPKEKE